MGNNIIPFLGSNLEQPMQNPTMEQVVSMFSELVGTTDFKTVTQEEDQKGLRKMVIQLGEESSGSYIECVYERNDVHLDAPCGIVFCEFVDDYPETHDNYDFIQGNWVKTNH